MKKTILERIERKNNSILEQTGLNVYLNFDDKATEDMLKKEYLEMKDFKIIKENNIFLGKKSVRRGDDILERLEKTVSESNNSAIYSINRKNKSINIIIDKNLLKNVQLKTQKIEKNLNLFGLDDIIDAPIKKNEAILNMKRIENFQKSYSAFLKDPRFLLVTEKIDTENINYDYLFTLYNQVKQSKNYFNAVSTGKLIDKKVFDKFLFHFYLFKEETNPNIDFINKIIKFDPSIILECPIIKADIDDTEDIINNKIKNGMQHDLVILRGFLKHFGLDNNKFTLDYIKNNYNNKNIIDVIDQESDFHGFIPNKHTRKQWQMGDYINYVNQFNSPKEKILHYAVNIELDKYRDLYDELENNLSPLLVFGSKYDILSHVRQHIKGMTIPQMYIKVPGVWTGGHEENLRMRSVNINHGPGDSLWWGVMAEDSQKVYETSLNMHKFNIYRKEGIFFPENNFLLENNIRTYHVVQKEGDIVLVGPGSIHWVRALSHSINTSWNFGTKDSSCIKHSLERYNLNKEIKFRSLIPLMTLFLDVLNKELMTLNDDFIETIFPVMTNLISNEINIISNIEEELQKSNPNEIIVMKEPEQYKVQICEQCFDEVFNLYGYCEKHSNTKTQIILCTKCFKKHVNSCNNKGSLYYFYRYDENSLLKFISRLNNRYHKRNMNSEEIQLDLTRITKDTEDILDKKLIKIVKTELPFPILKEIINHDLVSPNLLPLVDREYLNEELLTPLQKDVKIELSYWKELILSPEFTPLQELNDKNVIDISYDFCEDASVSKSINESYKIYEIKNEPHNFHKNIKGTRFLDINKNNETRRENLFDFSSNLDNSFLNLKENLTKKKEINIINIFNNSSLCYEDEDLDKYLRMNKARNEIKSIKSILSDFTSNECLKYRCSSEIMRHIYEVKKILIKNFEFRDLFQELDIKGFIQKIVDNVNLLDAYKEIFSNELLNRLF